MKVTLYRWATALLAACAPLLAWHVSRGSFQLSAINATFVTMGSIPLLIGILRVAQWYEDRWVNLKYRRSATWIALESSFGVQARPANVGEVSKGITVFESEALARKTECYADASGVYINLPDLGRLWIDYGEIDRIVRAASDIEPHPRDFAKIRFRSDVPPIMVTWNDSFHKIPT